MSPPRLLSYRDPKFWERFHDRHWKPRVPTVLRRPFREPPFTEAMVLAALKRFRDGLDRGDAKFRHMVSVGKRPSAPGKALRNLYTAEGETMGELESAWSRRFPREGLGLMINNFQSLDPGLWDGAASFLADGHRSLDFPISRAVVDLFFGNYQRSFLGLHKDTQEIFGFVVRGEKTILAWPFDYFVERVKGVTPASWYFQVPLRIDYRKYRKDAIVLHAKAGDVLYWPRDYWHVAEARGGEFSTMLSLGLFLSHHVGGKRGDDLARFREKLLLPAPDGAPLRSGEMSDESRGAQGTRRLRWASGHGFLYGGPMQGGLPSPPASDGPARTARKKRAALLLWRVNRARTRVLVTANGRLTTVNHSRAMGALLEALARGEKVEVRAPRSRDAESPIRATYWDDAGVLRGRSVVSRGDDRAWLLDWLLAIGAVEPAHQ